MGRKKSKQETEDFTGSNEFTNYQKMADELFEAKHKASSSAVSSTIDGLTKESVIVSVNQSISEPSIIVDDELLNIPSALRKGMSAIPFIINKDGIKAIRNACQNSRNQWAAVCIGKLSPGIGDETSTANEIGMALQVGGYLVTKTSLPYGLFRYKKWEKTFYEALDTYVAEYPDLYKSEFEAVEKLYLSNLLESWYIRGESKHNNPFRGVIKRKAFDNIDVINKLSLANRERCKQLYEIEDDDLKDYYIDAIADKTITEGKEKMELFVLYFLDFKKGEDSVKSYTEIAKISLNNFMIRAKAQVPSPDNSDNIRSLFSLRFTMDRVPTSNEIQKARENRIEREWAAGVKKFAQEAGIKSRVQTVYEIQESLREKISDNWESLILENLKDALKDALNKVKRGNQENVKYTSVQTLLGKQGANPKAGLLDQLMDIASDLDFGDKKLLELLEDVKSSARKNDPKIVSRELEEAIKDISMEISGSFGKGNINDDTIDLVDFDPLINEPSTDKSNEQDLAIDIDL